MHPNWGKEVKLSLFADGIIIYIEIIIIYIYIYIYVLYTKLSELSELQHSVKLQDTIQRNLLLFYTPIMNC